jgi:hypothetical protein
MWQSRISKAKVKFTVSRRFSRGVARARLARTGILYLLTMPCWVTLHRWLEMVLLRTVTPWKWAHAQLLPSGGRLLHPCQRTTRSSASGPSRLCNSVGHCVHAQKSSEKFRIKPGHGGDYTGAPPCPSSRHRALTCISISSFGHTSGSELKSPMEMYSISDF